MHSNDTLVDTSFQLISDDTSFQLISDFFHVNQGVWCFEHAEQASSRDVLGGGGGGGGGRDLLHKGGGSNRLPGLVTKQQAVEFPQVLASVSIIILPTSLTSEQNVVQFADKI